MHPCCWVPIAISSDVFSASIETTSISHSNERNSKKRSPTTTNKMLKSLFAHISSSKNFKTAQQHLLKNYKRKKNCGVNSIEKKNNIMASANKIHFRNSILFYLNSKNETFYCTKQKHLYNKCPRC